MTASMNSPNSPLSIRIVGCRRPLSRQVAEQLTAHDALGAHARDELGISEVLSARPIQAAFASAATFAVGAAPPRLIVVMSPARYVVPLVASSSLVFLVILGGVSAYGGGAPIIKAATRVAFWGALAMALTAGSGHCSRLRDDADRIRPSELQHLNARNSKMNMPINRVVGENQCCLHPALPGLLFAVLTLLFGFGLGIVFGLDEEAIKSRLSASADEVRESAYHGDEAAIKAALDKSWVYMQRAHLHAGGIGTAVIGLILVVVLLGTSPGLTRVISLGLGVGGLGYSVYWLLAGFRARVGRHCRGKGITQVAGHAFIGGTGDRNCCRRRDPIDRNRSSTKWHSEQSGFRSLKSKGHGCKNAVIPGRIGIEALVALPN